MSDNITLPRGVVEGALEALDSEHPDIQLRAAIALRTALAAPKQEHPGYVIGSHWLETAYSRICAGEAEADVLRDCGWERVDDAEALRRENERLREALEKVVAADDDLNDELTYICGRLLEEIKAALRRGETT